jgi:uncharacterized protein (TIGR02597 family)
MVAIIKGFSIISLVKHMGSFRNLVACGFFSLIAIAPVQAVDEAVTVPEGFFKLSFPATSAVTTSYVSFPLASAPQSTLPVSAITSNTIQFSGTPLTAGALATAGSPFYACVKTGPMAGRALLITGNTTSQITVDITDGSAQSTPLDGASYALAAGNIVEIIAGDTLAGTLGDNSGGNPLVFVGGTSALNADTVGVYNSSTAKFDTYFFSTALGYWRSSASTINQNGMVIPPQMAVSITRRASRPATSLVLLGRVPSVAPLIKTTGGSQIIYTSTRYPVDLTFSALSLSNWTKANSALSADTLSIYNASLGKDDVYYQKLDGTWRKVGDAVTDQSSVVIPAGTGVSILKRAAVSAAASYISVTLPYSL